MPIYIFETRCWYILPPYYFSLFCFFYHLENSSWVDLNFCTFISHCLDLYLFRKWPHICLGYFMVSFDKLYSNDRMSSSFIRAITGNADMMTSWNSGTIMWYENRRYIDTQDLSPSIYKIGTWIAEWPDLQFLHTDRVYVCSTSAARLKIILTPTIHCIDILGKYKFKRCQYAKQR